MLKIVIHHRPTIKWHKRYVEFFLRGFSDHDVEVSTTQSITRSADCDIAILFGTNSWKQIEKIDKPYIMVNRKFFGTDPKSIDDVVALSWNGLNGKGTFSVDEVSEDRIYKFINSTDIKTWNGGKGHILLCGQADLGRCTKYKNLEEWYNSIKKSTGLPIKFRPHPTKGGKGPLANDTYGAKCAVTLNSTVSIDLLMMGVPVVTIDKGDPTYGITGHTLDDIKRPNRLPLLQYLAHCQYHYTEIEDGTFWKRLYPKRGKALWEFNDGI